MSAGLKNMKDHVKAVSNIKKITSSMKVVAAAKFGKSEKDLRVARPLGIGALYFYFLSKFKDELTAPHISFFAVTSDRGLCGSMHAKVCKAVKGAFQGIKETYDIVCIGEKAKGILQFDESQSISLVVNGVGHRAPTFLDASKIVTRTFRKDQFMQGSITYTKFTNMVSFVVDNVALYSLPLMLSSKSLDRYEMDSHDEDLLSYLEFSQCAIVYYTLCETYLVETSSRIMAMSNASKNAEKMTKSLQLELNRKRQQIITVELIDIVSGAQVVSKGK